MITIGKEISDRYSVGINSFLRVEGRHGDDERKRVSDICLNENDLNDNKVGEEVEELYYDITDCTRDILRETNRDV